MSRKTIRRQSAASKKIASRDSSRATTSSLTIALGLLLIIGTIILYSPVRSHDFINYDDPDYVVNNSHVKMGLSWETLRWSITSREEANWHPLTWWSHAADYEFFGPDAGSHHTTSLLIHVLNVFLLFILLVAATRAPAPSFIVAAIFAWHPFNVESVAWVAERKNVLCALFFFLTLAAYGWFARKPDAKRLAIVSGVFLLALAAKPMAVVLPFALLLLDYWPLQRIAGWTSPPPESSIPQQPVSRLLIEKLPLFALTIASSAITVWAQSSGGLRSVQSFPLPARLENALYSYAIYVLKTFWPLRLGLFYPHPGISLPLWKPAVAAIFLGAVSFAVWMQRNVRPYLVVGWLWFLGVLFPMIGVVQVGDQAMADRYAYLSTIGLFVIVAWGLSEALDRLHAANGARWGAIAVILATVWFLTSRQISYWQDSAAIWSHTLEVTSANPLAEDKLGFALIARGDQDEAMGHFLNAVHLNSSDVGARMNLGAYYASHGRLQDAMQEFQTAVALTNEYKFLSGENKGFRCSALLDLGFAYTILKDYPQALANLQAADQTDPSLVDRTQKGITRSLANKPSEDASLKSALLLSAEGQREEAISALRETLDAHPEYSRAPEVLQFLSSTQQ